MGFSGERMLDAINMVRASIIELSSTIHFFSETELNTADNNHNECFHVHIDKLKRLSTILLEEMIALKELNDNYEQDEQATMMVVYASPNILESNSFFYS